MSHASHFAMIVSGEMDEIMEKQMKAFNVKLDMNQTMHIEAFSRKTGMNRSEVLRHFLDAGIEAVWGELDKSTKKEMDSITLEAAQDICKEFR